MKAHHWIIVLSFLTCVVSTVTAGDDWPQIQGGPAHTGYIAQEGPRMPFKVAWSRSLGTPFHPSQTMVIGDGRCYVGGGNGILYGLKRETGETLWTYPTGAPIIGSPAYADGLVYINSTDRSCHAVKADDGSKAWTFRTEQPLWAAPVVADGKVFVGGRDGFVYALDAKSGEQVWKSPIGGQVMATPGYGDGTLYVPAGDLCMYAYNGADGKQIWKSEPIRANAIRDGWVVVAHGYVLFTSMPEAKGNDFDRIQKEVVGPWMEKHKQDKVFTEDDEIFKSMQAWMEKHPAERKHHILDAKTGAIGRIMPILGVVAGGGSPTPPAVDDEGWAYVFYQNAQVGASGNMYFGRYNLKTEAFDPLLRDRYAGPAGGMTGRPSHRPIGGGQWDRKPEIPTTYDGEFLVTDHAWAASLAGTMAYTSRIEDHNQDHDWFEIPTRKAGKMVWDWMETDKGAPRVRGEFRNFNHSFGMPFAVSGKMLFYTAYPGNLVAYEGQ